MKEVLSKGEMNRKICLFIVTAIILFGLITCQSGYPPMSDYQAVGYVPIESATSGKLFITGADLIALYDTAYNDQWAMMRRYDLSDPLEPVMIDSGSLDTPIDYNYYYYLTQQDSLVFLYRYYIPLRLLNLNTFEMVDIDVNYEVKALVYKDNFLFMNTDSGLVIWDIADVQNIIEVYNEHNPYSRWTAQMVFLDTILFECYQGYEDKFKFWNIKDPSNPQIIATGDFSYQFSGVGMTEQYIIGYYYELIDRFTYDFSDSLRLEESKYVDYSIREFKLSDSLIYLNSYNCLTIITIDNFDEHWAIHPREYYYYYTRFLSQEIYGTRIYALVRSEGIYIYERREP